MAHPVQRQTDPSRAQRLEERCVVQLLVAPCAQLSGDGQLRELMQERRRHLQTGSGGLWYLPPQLTAQLGLRQGSDNANSQEALAIADPSAAIWLQLRFGGELQQHSLSTHWLNSCALELPAPAPPAAVA